MTITTPHGTEVALAQDPDSGDTIITVAREGIPTKEAGRVTHLEGDDTLGFQPLPFAGLLMRPDVLRAIADLIDAKTQEAPSAE